MGPGGRLVQMWVSVEYSNSCSPGFINKQGEVIDLYRTRLAGDSPTIGAWWRGLPPTLSDVPRSLLSAFPPG